MNKELDKEVVFQVDFEECFIRPLQRWQIYPTDAIITYDDYSEALEELTAYWDNYIDNAKIKYEAAKRNIKKKITVKQILKAYEIIKARERRNNKLK